MLALVFFLLAQTAAAPPPAHPCQSAPEYRQFDFWAGEWDVEIKGKLAGQSSVQLILDQCVIFENFTAGTYAGKSFSSWVAEAKEWKQHYIDTNGINSEWSGHLEDGKMIFISHNTRGGKPFMQRMTYTKEAADRVRQFIETSIDGGKTWKPGFDGMYIRRK